VNVRRHDRHVARRTTAIGHWRNSACRSRLSRFNRIAARLAMQATAKASRAVQRIVDREVRAEDANEARAAELFERGKAERQRRVMLGDLLPAGLYDPQYLMRREFRNFGRYEPMPAPLSLKARTCVACAHVAGCDGSVKFTIESVVGRRSSCRLTLKVKPFEEIEKIVPG
jgi:hypothetical protein